MYPAPLMNKLASIQQEQLPITPVSPIENNDSPVLALAAQVAKKGFFTQIRDESVWWMFWMGIYVNPGDSSTLNSHYQLYIILTFFVIEKMCQRWLRNRNGCTLDKIRQFKELDE